MAKKRATKKSTKATSKKVNLKKLQDTGRQIEAEVKVAGKKANAFAKKNPWAVAGAAAGLGLALGFLGGRKAKKKR